MSIAEKLTTIADNLQRVYEAGELVGFKNGKQAEYDAFWDTFQDYGNRRAYYQAFQKYWTDETYNPKYPIITDDGGNTNAYDIFAYNSNITDTKVDIDISRSKATRNLFVGCTNLVTVRKIITSETVTSFLVGLPTALNLKT